MTVLLGLIGAASIGAVVGHFKLKKRIRKRNAEIESAGIDEKESV